MKRERNDKVKDTNKYSRRWGSGGRDKEGREIVPGYTQGNCDHRKPAVEASFVDPH